MAAVATNRPSCGGAAFARAQGIPLGELSQRSFGSSEERDAAMERWLKEEVAPTYDAMKAGDRRGVPAKKVFAEVRSRYQARKKARA